MDELDLVLSQSSNWKSSGPDGITLEAYKYLLPKLNPTLTSYPKPLSQLGSPWYPAKKPGDARQGASCPGPPPQGTRAGLATQLVGQSQAHEEIPRADARLPLPTDVLM